MIRSMSPASPSVREQLRVWVAIGSQSLGGGSSTLYLMRQRLVDRGRWLTTAAFVQDWTISKLTPGMTIVALAALLGRRMDGLRGAAISVGGLLIPAGIITALMTGGYGLIRDQPLAQAALLGMGSVTIGMTIGVNSNLARTAVRPGRRGLVDVGLVVVAVIVGLLAPDAPIPVIVGSLVVGGLVLRYDAPSPEGDTVARE
jgi:chromate transporter